MDNPSALRQGADIFAADMVEYEGESKIAETFRDATVFLTGGTGFLGKLYMEKLLRSCPKLKKLYLLARPKKGKDAAKRIEEIFDSPSMVPLKLTNRNFINKVEIIQGDCILPDLGLDENTKKTLIEETNFVIHCAATVRFDEKIKTATYINVRAVKDLLAMAKQMKGLKAFLHVSTAYSNCPRRTIDETFYDPVMPAESLIDLVETLDEDRLTKMTPGLLGEWPNTYAFTKAIAESLVKREIHNLPIAVLRPSIVIASINEPVKGWIDNFFGPTGLLVGVALGLVRSMLGNAENIADVIPCDIVVNSGLAVIWDIASRGLMNDQADITEEPVYNCVSSPESPITWGSFIDLSYKHARNIPSELQIWHECLFLWKDESKHNIARFLLHTIPAHLVDFICWCIGREKMMVKGYRKLENFGNVVSYFMQHEWKFSNDKIQKLWEKMDAVDQKEFHFSIKNLDWDENFYFYLRGARVYLLKDPLETIPKGRVKYWKLAVAHYTLIAVTLFLLFKLLCLLWSCIF